MEYKTTFEFSYFNVKGEFFTNGSRFYQGDFKTEKEALAKHSELFHQNELNASNITAKTEEVK